MEVTKEKEEIKNKISKPYRDTIVVEEEEIRELGKTLVKLPYIEKKKE